MNNSSMSLAFDILKKGGAGALMEFACTMQDTEKYFYIGVARIQNYEDEEAIHSFQRHLKEAPRSIGAICNLALIFEQRNEWQEAEDLLTNALNIDSGSTKIVLQHVHLLRNWARLLPKLTENQRLRLLKERQALILLRDTIHSLLAEAKFDEEWLLDHGRKKFSSEGFLAGMGKSYSQQWGDPFASIAIADLPFEDLIQIVTDWKHIQALFGNSNYKLHVTIEAACPQRDCWLQP